MSVNRREFLKMAGIGLGGLVLPVSTPKKQTATKDASESASMLYDASLCIGCRACQTACKERAGLPPVTDSQNLYEFPTELNANNWTLIKLFKENDAYQFIKKQCMHCLDPACTSVCPVKALEKTPEGPVVYHSDICIGCRYCMTACPFEVPKYQWDKVNPLVQKCDFCADRLAEGLEPACGAACPTGALISGRRGHMLEVAQQRITEKPDFYVDHIYGETEAGGTSMLYLANVAFQKLGFPNLDDRPLPEITWPYMKSVPIVFFGMGGLLTAIYYLTHRNEGKEKE
ncbi:MAG: hydrogenase 2 operon protein HybA [Anaerolineaceae bacterium]